MKFSTNRGIDYFQALDGHNYEIPCLISMDGDTATSMFIFTSFYKKEG